METAPLKSFATWARTELITQVSARIAAVLAPASPERTEDPRAIRALETDIAKAGGDAKGKDAVADKVAYTWFNRIIALRFMDANGYTNAGVVSPVAGQTVGQPEVLADAKRGTFDPDVVNAKIAKDVTGLLDGTRSSTDPQGEAYTLLLAEYCRYWNKSMPFMFEREGDYTELLIPSNLLADESILTRAITTMTSAVCEDVEVIGWLYQFYISERKDEVFAGFKKNKKAGATEIPAATQLFTPHWIVRYLVENSVGRLWMLNHPESRLVDQMDYYIAPVDEESDFLKLTGPEALTVIDPACGSGHMLTYAFDLLYAIYEEEGYSPSEIPTLILTHNLYGTEIDPRAGSLAAFALTMKARAKQRRFFGKNVEPNICVLEPISFSASRLSLLLTFDGDHYVEEKFWNKFEHADTFGALIRPDLDLTHQLGEHLKTIDGGADLLSYSVMGDAHRVLRQAEYLARTYSVAVANPPYMGSKQMNSLLSQFMKDEYPDAKSDLFAGFIERCADLAEPRGTVAMITMQAWMFLSSFERLRANILEKGTIETLAHLGSGAFDSIGGDVVSTTAFVFSVSSPKDKAGIYLNLTGQRSEAAKSREMLRLINSGGCFSVKTRKFLRVSGSPIAYWLSESELGALIEGERVSDVATPRKGLVTLNDARFTRRWYEVSRDRTCLPEDEHEVRLNMTWYPLNKGGGYRRWYGLNETVINWKCDGKELKDYIVERYRGGSYTKEIRSEEYYFLESITWGAVSSGAPSFRYTPPGFIFSSGGSSLFSDSSLLSVMGSLNSTPVSRLLQMLTPTMNFVPGDVARMPIVVSSSLDSMAQKAVRLARADWDTRETSWDFATNTLVRSKSKVQLESRVEQIRDSDALLTAEFSALQRDIDKLVSFELGLDNDAQSIEVDPTSVTIDANERYEFPDSSPEDLGRLKTRRLIVDLVSYSVGCMFGRYSLDKPGLIICNQGATLQDYISGVPQPTFAPDADNVLPIVEGDWFEDDIVARFREFLRAAFGEDHFEVNLRFVEESLGVKSLRDYFITRGGKSKFYEDHVKRYKKRPIYWMFSSPKGAFNALIYMHRYNPSMVSTVLNDYLREYEAKLEASLHNLEREANGDSTPRQQAAAAKEAERLRKILVELSEYEHEVMYPLASEQISIDLDDGVKSNYPKFGSALKKIQGL